MNKVRILSKKNDFKSSAKEMVLTLEENFSETDSFLLCDNEIEVKDFKTVSPRIIFFDNNSLLKNLKFSVPFDFEFPKIACSYKRNNKNYIFINIDDSNKKIFEKEDFEVFLNHEMFHVSTEEIPFSERIRKKYFFTYGSYIDAVNFSVEENKVEGLYIKKFKNKSITKNKIKLHNNQFYDMEDEGVVIHNVFLSKIIEDIELRDIIKNRLPELYIDKYTALYKISESDNFWFSPEKIYYFLENFN